MSTTETKTGGEQVKPKRVPKGTPITDRFGNTYVVGDAGDLWVPPFPIPEGSDYRSCVEGIRDMEVREDDILMCSYPKTGTHWNSSIITMLLKGTICHGEAQPYLLEAYGLDSLENLGKPRLLNTHLPLRYIPRQTLEKNTKIVFLCRNPRDTMVSAYNHMLKNPEPRNWTGSFEHFFYMAIENGLYYGDIFEYYTDWYDRLHTSPEIKIYVSVFEEMKADPVGAVKKLNEFLGTGRSPEFCEEVARSCSFDVMKKNQPSNPYLGAKLPIFRKGEVDDWKNWFSEEMEETFKAIYKTRANGKNIFHQP